MGRIQTLDVLSTGHLLKLLGVRGVRPLAREFHSLATKLLPCDEDWSTEPELLETLYCYVRSTSPHTVVEIGTYRGTSACVLATALERNGYGHLYTIDNDVSGTVRAVRDRLRAWSLQERVTLLQKNSSEAFADWGRAKIDLLYIDGGHSFLDTCLDFALWCRYIPRTGLIVVHDTVTRLMRRFPEDYVCPLEYYDVLHVTGMQRRPSQQEWEGTGFIRTSSP
jgi:predicted O-methyltransferase YrrM